MRVFSPAPCRPPAAPPTAALAALAAKSPFSSMLYRCAGCVHTFEVPFASLAGLDYSNPLLREGRLVLEVHSLRQREFPTVGWWCCIGAGVVAACG